MRVLFPSAAQFLTDHLPNGEGLIAWHLLSALARRGIDVIAVVQTADLRAAPQFEIVETRRGKLESLAPLVAAQQTHRLTSRLMRDRQIDAAHWLFPQGAFPVPSGLPYVVGPLVTPWPQNTDPHRPRRVGDTVACLVHPVIARLQKEALQRSARILLSTPSALSEVPARLRTKTEVLPFGIDISQYRTMSLPSGPVVLFLGALEARKGCNELLGAWPRVLSRVPTARLRIVGEGSLRNSLALRIQQDGLGESVIMLPAASHEETIAHLSECSLLAAPSRGEPFGMVVLEAMASGRAVLAGESGGPRHILPIPDGGRLVATEPAAIAEGLVSMLTDETLLQRAGAVNRARAEMDFSLDRVVERLEGVYVEVIGHTLRRRIGRPVSPLGQVS